MPTNKQRREAARRHLERQLQRRQEQEAAQKRRMLIATIAGSLILVVVVVVVVIAVTRDNGSSNSAAGSQSPSPTSTYVTTTTSGPCGYASANIAENTQLKYTGFPPDPKPTPTKTVVANFTTNRGLIQVTMDGKAAPCMVQSIAFLIQKKFYDNTPCPRSVNQGIYVVQCGDPSGTGAGGPSYTVKDENLAKASYTAGAVAMANGGANTNGSQFFFITKDSNQGLQKNYTVFGHVTKGLDILEKVAAGGDDGSNQAGGGKPKLPLSFATVRIASVVGGGATPGTGPSPTLITPSPTAASTSAGP